MQKKHKMQAKALEIIYDTHIDGKIILDQIRKKTHGVHKAFIKWHVNQDGDGEGNHTHLAVILRDKPQFLMDTNQHKNYFGICIESRSSRSSEANPEPVGVENTLNPTTLTIYPRLVAPLGKGNSRPIRKLCTYVDYLVDGHDNGHYEQTWNYKYDHELLACETFAIKTFLRMKRGESYNEIYCNANINDEYKLLEQKRKIMNIWNQYEQQRLKKAKPPPLRETQKEILSQVETQDDRKLLWVYDPTGNNGKTWLLRWLGLFKDACIINNAKKADIACAYRGQSIVGVNLTRTVGDRVCYEAMEQLKDGLVFDGKYESNTYIRPFDSTCVKLVVMSNELPDTSSMSEDRWSIQHIDELGVEMVLPDKLPSSYQ